ncbi:MAG: NosD domain-containing protein [Candidatus Thorarchaeota archaeon]
MKLVARVTGIFFMAILVLSIGTSVLIPEDYSTSHFPRNDTTLSQSVEIEIGNDSDFIDQGWSGNGTEIDPFVLQNQGLGVSGDTGFIEIRNTSSHFVIRNCQLLLLDIIFFGVSNGKIEGSTLTNCSIIFDSSHDCVLLDNDIFYSTYGYENLWLLRTTGCEIRENQFSGGFIGISLEQSNDTTIADNTFIDHTFGAVSGDFGNTTLINNTFQGTGIKMEFWDPRIDDMPPKFINNSVNGKPPGIFFNLVDAEIDGSDYGQIILARCNETTVVGGSISNCVSGVQLIQSINCTIDGITISDCTWQGITAEWSPRIRIVDSHISNGDEFAIFMSQCPFYFIDNCTIADNLGGIHPHIYSNNGTIKNCTITRNKPPESEYFQTVAGLHLSNNATAIGNTITENNVGIIIYGAYCLVIDNVITYNGYGIYITDTYDGYGEAPYANRIYGNDIGWNYMRNAYDNTLNYNQWDDGVSIGNAWSDYYGIGYYEIARDTYDHFPSFLPKGGIPLFYIHVGVGIPTSIAIIVALIMVSKRRVGIPDQPSES